jgi:hypothetical protein
MRKLTILLAAVCAFASLPACGDDDGEGAGGKLIWAKSAGGIDDDYTVGIAALPDGSALVIGGFDNEYFDEGTVTFGSGEANETVLTSAGWMDVFISKYNADGTLAWAKRAGGSYNDSAHGIAVLSDGSALVAGDFVHDATFGPGEENETVLPSLGNPYYVSDRDIFVAKFAL